jgi:type I restriction enzyme S subunit
LSLSATTSGTFDPRHFKFVDADVPADSHLWLREGDLLIQRSNTREYVGRAAIVCGPDTRFIYPDLMMRCRLTRDVSTRFVHLWLMSPTARDLLSSQASGTSSSMVKINQEMVRQMPVPLPSLAEQHRIVARVDELMALCDTLASRLAAAVESSTAFAAAFTRVDGTV